MAPVLEYDGISKEYRSAFGRQRVRALDHFSLTVERGEIFGFLGPNGAGKTTAIHLALGFMRASHGKGKMLGHRFGHAATRARVGFLPENIALYHRSAAALVRFYGALNKLRDPQLAARVRDVLEEVEMTNLRFRNAAKFSRGMQQRIGLAQALVSDPDLLILDEPTSALDPLGRIAVRELLLRTKAAGKTIFLSSHLLSEVEVICDRVAFLNHGRLLRIGKTAELLEAKGEYMITARGVDPRQFPGSTSVNGILSVPVLREAQRAAIESIWARGGEIISVTPVRRSLEDLFVELSRVGSSHDAPRTPGSNS